MKQVSSFNICPAGPTYIRFHSKSSFSLDMNAVYLIFVMGGVFLCGGFYSYMQATRRDLSGMFRVAFQCPGYNHLMDMSECSGSVAPLAAGIAKVDAPCAFYCWTFSSTSLE